MESPQVEASLGCLVPFAVVQVMLPDHIQCTQRALVSMSPPGESPAPVSFLNDPVAAVRSHMRL